MVPSMEVETRSLYQINIIADKRVSDHRVDMFTDIGLTRAATPQDAVEWAMCRPEMMAKLLDGYTIKYKGAVLMEDSGLVQYVLDKRLGKPL